jgi:hypothetical protein
MANFASGTLSLLVSMAKYLIADYFFDLNHSKSISFGLVEYLKFVSLIEYRNYLKTLADFFQGVTNYYHFTNYESIYFFAR